MKSGKTLLKLPKFHCAAFVSASMMIGAALVFSPSKPAEANRIQVSIPVASKGLATKPIVLAGMTQPISATAVAAETATKDVAEAPIAELSAEPPIQWRAFQVQSGDSLYTLFKRAGVSPKTLAQMLSEIKDDAWTRLYPKEELEFGFRDGNFEALRIHRSQLENWIISANDSNVYDIEKVIIQPDIQVSYAEGVINSALFIDAKKAGLNDELIMELANIFGWDIDFILDIRQGDSFRLVYEEEYLNGKKVGNGNILAAEFVNQGRELRAVRYVDSNGRANYYAPNGDSMKKAFLRSPVDFARISSHFNLKRKHPVLHKIRAHKGTDYAAGRGTPIKTTGDGKVIFAGRKGGYGNVVIVQHGQSIETLYAHMKSFARGIRVGKRVAQGQVIGYVGSSGLATGPHLHFEFRKNGVHKNPVTVKLPKAEPIKRKELAQFKSHAEIVLGQLDTFANQNVALNGSSDAAQREL